MVKVKNDDLEKKAAYLLLEDGSLFEGQSFGANIDTDGELGLLFSRTKIRKCLLDLTILNLLSILDRYDWLRGELDRSLIQESNTRAHISIDRQLRCSQL